MINEPDKEAFLKLIQLNKGIIFKICNSYCKNRDDREDLAQEIVFELWRSFPRYNSSFKYSTWMYRIALNIAISFYRKERTRNIGKVNTVHLQETHPGDKDSDQLEQNIRLLHQFVDELKELDKALMLLYLEKKSYAEIGDIIGISETNVATKINRIKAILRQKFNAANN